MKTRGIVGDIPQKINYFASSDDVESFLDSTLPSQVSRELLHALVMLAERIPEKTDPFSILTNGPVKQSPFPNDFDPDIIHGALSKLLTTDRKIPGNVKENGQIKEEFVTFKDLSRCDGRSGIVVCCANFSELLNLGANKGEICDVLTVGPSFSPFHLDSMGQSRFSVLVTEERWKMWIFLRSRNNSLASTRTFRAAYNTWPSGDVHQQLQFVVDNNQLFLVVMQGFNEPMQHCGAYFHAVLTFVPNGSNGMALSLGYRESAPSAVAAYLKNVPENEKGFITRKGFLSPIKNKKDEQKYAGAVWKQSGVEPEVQKAHMAIGKKRKASFKATVAARASMKEERKLRLIRNTQKK